MLGTHIAMHVSPRVHHLHPLNCLPSDIEDKPEGKLTTAREHEAVERWPEHFEHEIVEAALSGILNNTRNAEINYLLSLNVLDNAGFSGQLRVAHRPLLDLDGYYCLVLEVQTLENFIEGTDAQLAN